MEIRVLKYFLAVAREENITKAAEALHITQPTLSRQMAELEKELHTRLFFRGKRKIFLTDAGILLRRRAEEIVALANKTEIEFIQNSTSKVSGSLSIGAGETSASDYLARLISGFSQKYPLVTYQLYTGTADHIKERLDSGLLDLGLLLEPVDIQKYDFFRLKKEETWGVLLNTDSPLAKRDSITREELRSYPLFFPQRSMVEDELAAWFGDDFHHLHILATHNMISNTARLVEQNVGCAVTIHGSVSLYQNPILCFRPLDPPLIRSSVFVWKKSQPWNSVVGSFLEYIKNNPTK